MGAAILSPPNTVAQSSDVSLATCKTCQAVVKSDTDLESHMKSKHLKEKCDKCSKEYTTKFEMTRHIWRSHEEISCNYCGDTVSSRQELKSHKEQEHNIKMNQNCRFFNDGKCVDASECLYSHNNTNNQTTRKNTRRNNQTDFCKDGLKCARIDCEYGDEKHRRIKDVPCRFQENCSKSECPFKHNQKTDFHKNKIIKRKN